MPDPTDKRAAAIEAIRWALKHGASAPNVRELAEDMLDALAAYLRAPEAEGGGTAPREAVMLIDDDGLPKWFSEHEEDHAKGRYRYVPALVADRLIAAAVAAKDRELADVREAWRQDRERLRRARIALDGIATLHGFTMTTDGRVEADERMREIARRGLDESMGGR